MMMISSIRSEAFIAAMVCSMIVLPAILMSCLGIDKPTREPVPPARITATFLSSVTAAAYRTDLCVSCSVGAINGSMKRQATSVNSGIELSALDAGIRPADDLFRHLNGTWLATTEIPADRATAGSFMDLFDEAEAKVRAIVESSAAGPQDDEQRKIGDLYTSFMDVDRIEALGSEPLGADLALVDEVTDISGLVATLGAVERSGVAGMFGMYAVSYT